MARSSAPKQASEGDGEMNYEQAMAELESLVARMEQGEVPLEESLKAFERGRALVARCKGILDDAERRIQQLGLDQLQADEGG